MLPTKRVNPARKGRPKNGVMIEDKSEPETLTEDEPNNEEDNQEDSDSSQEDVPLTQRKVPLFYRSHVC